MNSFRCALYLFAVAVTGSWISGAKAGDWPQLLGPQRDSQAPAPARPIEPDWKTKPPTILWRQPAAAGYAGAAIVGDTVYTFDRTTSNERLIALNLADGKTKWQATWKASYAGGTNSDNGPRVVPCVVGNKIICYGAAGDLVCVNATNGKLLWQRGLRQEFKAADGYFGAGCSPIVIRDRVIVNVGAKSAGIVAVALESGKDVWKATTFDASYASPIAVDAGGTPAALVVTRLQTVLLSAANGQVLGQVDFGSRGPTVNAATPLPLGNHRYFLTASYGIGAKVLRIDGQKLIEESADDQLLASQYNSPVAIDGVLIGANGREDMPGVALRTIDPQAMQLIDEQPLPGPTHFIAVGKQLLMLSNDGTLQLAQITARKVQLLSSFQLVEPGTDAIFRALPALADKVLIVRSSQESARGGEWIAITLP